MKKNKPQISVVIPAYNEALYIEPCLKSLENHTLNRNKYEIIVVDGNSTDKTREIARKYADFVLTETEKSVGKARNRGCKKASLEKTLLQSMGQDYCTTVAGFQIFFQTFSTLPLFILIILLEGQILLGLIQP